MGEAAEFEAKLLVDKLDQVQGRQKERGIHTKMRVKLAAKMLVIAWVMMKRKEVFDPGRLNIG